MGQVTVTLNGRSYRLRCGDGEEKRLLALSSHVKSKVDGLVAEFGQVGDDRLMLMAALLIADELWEARERSVIGAVDAVGHEPRNQRSGRPHGKHDSVDGGGHAAGELLARVKAGVA